MPPLGLFPSNAPLVGGCQKWVGGWGLEAGGQTHKLDAVQTTEARPCGATSERRVTSGSPPGSWRRARLNRPSGASELLLWCCSCLLAPRVVGAPLCIPPHHPSSHSSSVVVVTSRARARTHVACAHGRTCPHTRRVRPRSERHAALARLTPPAPPAQPHIAACGARALAFTRPLGRGGAILQRLRTRHALPWPGLTAGWTSHEGDRHWETADGGWRCRIANAIGV